MSNLPRCSSFILEEANDILKGSGASDPHTPEHAPADDDRPLERHAEASSSAQDLTAWAIVNLQSRFLGRGSDKAPFSEKKGVFSEEGGGIQ